MRAVRLAALVSGAALGAIVAANGVQAADLGLAPAYKAPPVAPFSWAGFFIGAHGGYGFGTESRSFSVLGLDIQDSLSPKGGFGGGQIGYNTYLIGNWMLGSVLDVSAADISQSGPGSALGFPLSLNSKTDFFGTARARVGYGFDRWLLYATGGTAWVHNKVNDTFPGVVAFGRDQFYLGWTAGAGLEYAFTPNWSIFAEYLYADLGREDDNVGPELRSTELILNTVRFGVNYRFDGSAPVAVAPVYPVKAPPPVASPWSGTYLGAYGGYAQGQTDVTDVIDASTLHPAGGFAGVETGFNWQFSPMFVFGMQSETSFGSLTQSGSAAPSGFATTTKIDWFGSELVRFGFLASPNLLLYGTGGLAWAHYRFSETAPVAFPVAIFDNWRIGWSGGAGAEWMFAPLWSATVEYLHSDLGTYRDSALVFSRTASLTLDSVKVGVNWHGDLLATLGSYIHLH